MTERMQPIIQHLFQADSLEDVSRERLEAFVEEYPSFGIGHYLLSRKLRTADDGHYLEKTGRTSLYFSNPLWLQWLLESQPVARQVVTEPVRPVEEPHQTLEEPQRTLEELHTPPVEEPVQPTEAMEPVRPMEAVEPGVEEELRQVEVMPEQAASVIEEPIRDEEVPFVLDEPVETTPEEAVPEETLEEEAMHDMEEEAVMHGGHLDPSWTGHPEEPAAPIKDEEPPFILDEPQERPEAPAADEQSERVAAAVMTAAKPAVEPATGPLAFEPYHTIDYFASQGIKLNLDEIPTTDKLGKQMKSFTDWLKTMRRLPQKEREIVPDMTAERNIQTIAAHSIEGREVLTEAMAEVLAKQGMRDKAREVYQKLSLLNPDKRAYFATKIEQLNTH